MKSDKEEDGSAARRRRRYHAAMKRVWWEALVRHYGNIAHASLEFGFCRQRGTAITKRYGLSTFAKKLRVNNGQPACGRPRLINEGGDE